MKYGISSGSALFTKKKSIFREGGYNICWRMWPVTPSIYTMDLPDLTVSNFMGNYIGKKRVVVLIVLPFCFCCCFTLSKFQNSHLLKIERASIIRKKETDLPYRTGTSLADSS